MATRISATFPCSNAIDTQNCDLDIVNCNELKTDI